MGALPMEKRFGAPECASFTIRSERGPNEHRIRVFGEMDLAVTGELDRELRRVEASDAPRIVLDLNGLEFLDASGAGLLFDLGSRSQHNGSRVRLRGALSHQVRRVLEVTGIGPTLPFEDLSSAAA